MATDTFETVAGCRFRILAVGLHSNVLKAPRLEKMLFFTSLVLGTTGQSRSGKAQVAAPAALKHAA